MFIWKFDKSRFADLLQKALGNRNMSEYALHSGVSLTYISELIKQERDNPPLPKTLRKLAEKAHNGVTYEMLMAAAGHLPDYTADHVPDFSMVGVGGAVVVGQVKNIPMGAEEVPLLGPIKAGVPILSEDNYTETITPPKGVHADFAAPVEGDSMRYAGIFPGDIAFFRECQEPQSGHIVAARVLDVDAAVNLKYYIKKNGHAVLRSANPEYPDIPFTENHAVVGIMTGLIRDWAPDVHDYENAIVLKERLDDQWREAVMQAIADGISPKEFSSLVTMMKKFLKG